MSTQGLPNGRTSKVLAYVMVGFFVVYSICVLIAIYYTEKVEAQILSTVTAFAGTVLGYAMREISLVYDFYFRKEKPPENPPTPAS